MYVGGSVTPLKIDPNMNIDLKAVVKELECPDISEMYQNGPNQAIKDGLVGVTSDETMLALFKMHKDNNSDVIDSYIHNSMMEHNKPSDEEISTLTKASRSVQIDDLIDLHDFDDIVDLDDIVNLDEDDEEEVEQEFAIKIINKEGEFSDKSADDLGCLSNPEDEGGNIKKHKLVEFDKDKDMKNPKLVNGSGVQPVAFVMPLCKA
ncbi:hypothetical protein RHSIM_Rhsim03G0178800 [Rhododendron simsii]|uniref:Uncharacterized protein n=1 Tax=Rhododendron simsii TaxID=118357 RepID=A0A834H5K4_RHOSS|nr:hypothetical protein RHSIM_Rhsim03G0178800 [Rhododendron simsii]